MKTRLSKIVRDLTSDGLKNSMLALAIALGIFGIGAILGGYGVIKREMRENYMGTTPASATIELEQDIPESLLDSINVLPGVRRAERLATITARMKIEEKWYPILLFVVDDFVHKQTNKVTHLSGSITPSPGTMLAERTALTVMQAKEGDNVIIKTPHGTPTGIMISGTVHDPGLAPAWQEQTGYGYITRETLHRLGEQREFNQLRILVSEQTYSREHITDVAEEVAGWLTLHHYDVHEIQVPPPGKHPHQSQMNAVMTIFVTFSFLVLVLASILVATSLSALMVKQVRQIGVMKAIGAMRRQIAGMYIAMLTIICLVAIVVAVPLSRITAAAFYKQIAVLLNLEINDSTIPADVLIIQLAAGLLIPFVVALFPILRGSRISVRQALDNFGIKQSQAYRQRKFIVPFLFRSDILQLSIRNAFRQRSRLAMTLLLLAAGGAMFMTALNVSKAWDQNLARIYTQRTYDLEVRLNNATSSDTLLTKIATLNGVRHVEGLYYTPTSFDKGAGFNVSHTYPDKGHGSFNMLAVPLPTELLHPTITAGRWLEPSTAREVVLNQLARLLLTSVNIGDSVSLIVDGKATSRRVVGFSEDVGSAATAYVSLSSAQRALNTGGNINMIRIEYTDRSQNYAMGKNRDVEALLVKENISIQASIPVWLLHNAVAGHMKVLVNSLMIMAILMALVGTIGLMSTMSINTLERTREIGVMRAIGATPARIKKLIVWEGLLVGSLSISIAIVLSLVLSGYIGRLIGNMAFRTPLSLAVSNTALGTWIILILFGSYIATLYPARRAIGITTRDALSYE